MSASTAGILAGELDVTEWSDEELIRGQRRDRNGRWSGRPPSVVPSAVHQELTRRRFQRSYSLLAESLVDAAMMLRAIVNDPRAKNADKIAAAQLIFDRVAGKAKQDVSLDLRGEVPPWRRLIQNSIVGLVGTEEQAREAEAALEAEVTELDDDEEERDGTPATLVQGSSNVAPGSTGLEEEADSRQEPYAPPTSS